MRIGELIVEKVSSASLTPGFSQSREISDGEFKLEATSDVEGLLSIKVYDKGGKEIGFASFSKRKRESDKEAYLRAGMITVISRYRKRGIAREIYKFVNDLGNDIMPSDNQTADGQNMWKGLAGQIRQPAEPPVASKKAQPSILSRVAQFAKGVVSRD